MKQACQFNLKPAQTPKRIDIMTSKTFYLPHLSLLAFIAATLTACGETPPESADTNIDPVVESSATPNERESVTIDGTVTITVDRLIPEDAACLLMMDVINGTDRAVTAGLFAFDVTGNGETAGANMFPQRAEPGSVTTAQIILPGADCENAKMIEGGQVNCRIIETEESCIDDLVFRDGLIDFSLNQ